MQALGPNQERWLAELESGKWKQGRGQLGDKHGYCCLGVACEALIPDGKQDYHGAFQWFDHGGVAPNELVAKLALYSKDGRSRDACNSLISMNDSDQKSFPEIAAIIRSDPSIYFTEPR
jgi:hypothetical protein